MLKGLSEKQADERLLKYGPNSVDLEKKQPMILVFLKNFYNPLLILLIGSSALSAYFGDMRSFITITAMVLLSGTLDFANTYKSDKAAQKLKEKLQLTSCVIRDGEEVELEVEKIVPGDILRLRVGDITPADGKFVQIEHCFTNESALTGESMPVAKQIGDPAYMGSSLATGEGWLEVTETGKATKFSHIVANLGQKKIETQFDKDMLSFSKLILKITILLMVFVFLVNSLIKGNILESLMFAVALAVGMTPEMMPMIITLNLTKGSLAMSKKGIIVKKLAAIQNFGSMDVLCTDKTGTLTEDNIALVKYVDIYGKQNEAVLHFAGLNSHFTQGFKNPLDEAVKEYGHIELKGYKKLAEIPYDFERKRESIIVKNDENICLITKGSPETILEVCENYGHYSCEICDLSNRPHLSKLNTKIKNEALDTYHKLSRGGFRVLAVAIKKLDIKNQDQYSHDKIHSKLDGEVVNQEQDMMLLGFLAFLDPPKLSVAGTLKQLADLGIKIKIITGDNELVSQRIAQEIGLKITGFVMGSQMDAWSDEELFKHAENVNLFARVNPDQKLRIIQVMKARGHTVGYLGDGINDAPSLKAADVGISVKNATDIARESADMIMLRKELDDLILGVIEGRKTFANTMKYLMMTLSSNFGNMFSMAGASAFLPFLPMLPSQVLLNNLLYDTSQFSIPADNVDSEAIKLPQKMDMKVVKRFMVVFGPISSLFDFTTFLSLLYVLHLTMGQFQSGWFMESLGTQVFVVFVIRTKLIPFWRSHPGKWLTLSMFLVVATGWIIGMGKIGSYFQFGQVSWQVALYILGLVAVYLIMVESVKGWFWRKYAFKK